MLNALKKKYKGIVDQMRRSGIGVESDDELEMNWKFFRIIHGVMGGHPTVILVHLQEIGSEPDASGSEVSSLVEEVNEQQDTESEDQQQVTNMEGQQPAEGENEQQQAEEETSATVPSPSQAKKCKLTKVDKVQKDI